MHSLEQAIRPGVPIAAVIYHLIMLLLVFGTVAGILHRKQRPATIYDAVIQFLVGLVLTGVFTFSLDRFEHNRDIQLGFIGFTWTVVLLGMLVT